MNTPSSPVPIGASGPRSRRPPPPAATASGPRAGVRGEARANSIEVIPGIDVSSDELVAKLAGAVGPHKIDRLLSNAGINHGSGGPGDADTTKMLNEFNVNVLGGIRVVRTLLPLLAPGARLGFISTGRGAAQVNPDPANGINYGYRITKAGLNMYVALLAQDLRTPATSWRCSTRDRSTPT